MSVPARCFSLFLLLGLYLGLGCAHAPGPASVAESYARALEQGRLAEAYALTQGAPEGQQAFLERYATPEARRARAAEVRAAQASLRAEGPSLSMVQRGRAWRVVEVAPEEAARAVLERFLSAVEAGEWATAWSLLAGPVRSRYTPERLRSDYEREPLAAERVRRARLALEGSVRLEEGEARLPLDGEAAVRLVLEGGEYRVAAME
jgi:hypothetical protein